MKFLFLALLTIPAFAFAFDWNQVWPPANWFKDVPTSKETRQADGNLKSVNAEISREQKSWSDKQNGTGGEGPGYKDQISGYQKTIARMQADVDKKDAFIEELKVKIESKSSGKDANGDPLFGADKIGDEALQDTFRQLKKARADLDKINGEIKTATNNLRALEAKADEDQRNHDTKIRGLYDKLPALTTELKIAELADHTISTDRKIMAAKAFEDISFLKDSVMDVSQQLDRLELLADRSATGVYVREKMLKIFKDPVFCKAKDSCNGGEPVNYDDFKNSFTSDGREILKKANSTQKKPDTSKGSQ